MRAMAGRFECTPKPWRMRPARCGRPRMNIAGAGWSGQAQATSYDTMGQMNQAFTQHREHAAGGARRADPRRQQLRGTRAGLAAAPEQLKALLGKYFHVRRTDDDD